ncbi:MAG: hypothetical protein IPH16_10705 [Haliscomenobacter sp.]|nr:hypothetical protein [Haliscomenobacter sp.]
MMQGWYWDYPKNGCNSYTGSSWAADMAARALAQKNAGFTMMWMPPLAKASFGDCSNGYDPKDLYDYGQRSGQTGVGTGAEVQAWVAALAANTIYPVADVVYNHRDGGDWGRQLRRPGLRPQLPQRCRVRRFPGNALSVEWQNALPAPAGRQ